MDFPRGWLECVAMGQGSGIGDRDDLGVLDHLGDGGRARGSDGDDRASRGDRRSPGLPDAERHGRPATVARPPDAPRGHMPEGYHFRDAMRLLFILAAGSEVRDDPGTSPDGSRVFVGEKRLMAVDFLVRYPDYLAHDLLDLYEADGDADLLRDVRAIFDRDEPDVRLVRMVRWRRGAFQNIETALAILDSRRLVRCVRIRLGPDRMRHEFVVLAAGFAFLDGAVSEQPILAWYRDRAALAMRVARSRSGSDLKGAQYGHPEYGSTSYGATIPSIKDRVLRRLRAVEARGR